MRESHKTWVAKVWNIHKVQIGEKKQRKEKHAGVAVNEHHFCRPCMPEDYQKKWKLQHGKIDFQQKKVSGGRPERKKRWAEKEWNDAYIQHHESFIKLIKR